MTFLNLVKQYMRHEGALLILVAVFYASHRGIDYLTDILTEKLPKGKQSNWAIIFKIESLRVLSVVLQTLAIVTLIFAATFLCYHFCRDLADVNTSAPSGATNVILQPKP